MRFALFPKYFGQYFYCKYTNFLIGSAVELCSKQPILRERSEFDFAQLSSNALLTCFAIHMSEVLPAIPERRPEDQLNTDLLLYFQSMHGT